MELLWPGPAADLADDDALAGAYAFPDAGPRVRANMVVSLDGRVTVAGRAGGLSGPDDQHLLELLRDLADVVLVGASTIRAEGYPNLPPAGDRRRRWGFSRPAPIAVVTSGTLTADLPLFTTPAATPPIVITTEQGADRLPDLPATVLTAGSSDLDLAAALGALRDRGLRRIHCEGGPGLLGGLIAADLLDELCLTTAPLVVGGNGPTLLGDAAGDGGRWSLRLLARAEDHLFARYDRRR